MIVVSIDFDFMYQQIQNDIKLLQFYTHETVKLRVFFLKDKSSSGASVQLQFLYEYMSYPLPIPVTEFDKCPIILTQPDKDRWTPLHLTEISMKGIKAPFTRKFLSGGGHYPMEEVALEQLLEYTVEFIESLQ